MPRVPHKGAEEPWRLSAVRPGSGGPNGDLPGHGLDRGSLTGPREFNPDVSGIEHPGSPYAA